jgi:DNA modification methylase
MLLHKFGRWMVNINIWLKMSEIKNSCQHLLFHYFSTTEIPWKLHKFLWDENSFILEHDAINQFNFDVYNI